MEQSPHIYSRARKSNILFRSWTHRLFSSEQAIDEFKGNNCSKLSERAERIDSSSIGSIDWSWFIWKCGVETTDSAWWWTNDCILFIDSASASMRRIETTWLVGWLHRLNLIQKERDELKQFSIDSDIDKLSCVSPASIFHLEFIDCLQLRDNRWVQSK